MAAKLASREVTAFLKNWIERENRAGKPYAEIAKIVGVSKTQVQNVKGGTRGVGQEMEENYAKRFCAGSVDELRKQARIWCEKNNPPVPPETDILPNRAAALARLRGLLDEETVRRVRSMRYPNGAAMSEFDWVWTAVQEQLALSRAALIEPSNK